jgi:N-acetylmuramoyl-L-alanine amidase
VRRAACGAHADYHEDVNFRLPLAALLVALTGGLAAVGMQAQPALAPTPGPQRTTWTLLREDGRQTLAVTRLNRFDYITSADLATLFGVTLREDRAGGLVLTFRGQTIVLSLDQGLASIGGRVVNLSTPPVRQGTGWLLPLDVLDRVLAAAPGDGPRIDVRRRSSIVVVGNVTVPAVTVRTEHQPTGTRVVLTIAPAAPLTVVMDQGTLLVRIAADALDADLTGVTSSPLLTGATVTSPATITLGLGAAFGSHRTTETPDAGGTRLTIDLLPAAIPSAEPTAPAAEAPELEAPLQLEQTGLRTIVLDPGHGGTELGARGPSGTLEKDIALSVARQLRAAIENRLGLRVLMTRSGDETVALDARAALANNNKADLFISLHANASVRSSATGAEVFYVSVGDYDAPGAEAAEPGAMLPVLGGGQRSVDLILWEMAQARHLNESARFASLVEEELRQRVPMSPRAIQQAPFRVLVGANMPAVLVEMGFITNPTEEKRLLAPEYQGQLVTTLLNAIIRFKASVDRVGSPSTQAGR